VELSETEIGKLRDFRQPWSGNWLRRWAMSRIVGQIETSGLRRLLRTKEWIMRSGICGLTLLLLMATAVAEEDAHSANAILPGCKAFVGEMIGQPPFKQGVCGGMVLGVLGMGVNLRDLCKDLSSCGNARLMCVNAPESVSVAEATRVVIKYLEANSNRLHEKFDWLAVEALQDAWPCK
jgi:hypothetical protein